MSIIAGVFQNLRRRSGAPGAPALKAGQQFHNEAETGGVVYAGFGDDGQGNATSAVAVGGRGAFFWKSRKVITDANYTILPTDTLVALTGTLTASRTFTLPPASAYDARQPLFVLDETGLLSDALQLVIAAAGSDVIVTGGIVTSMAMGSPGQKLTWHCDGNSKWTYG